MSTNPSVTVLMPVYNGETYLREAIESILNQTFSDFEFLIIDDGSTDSSVRIIRSYDDARIRLIRNDENIGLTPTLNRGLDLAKREYIARMDADDIAMPRRLERQVAFMERNRDICVCGTWVEKFGEGIKTAIWKSPSSPEMLKVSLSFSNSIAHPSVILRGEYVSKNKIRYSEDYRYAQDWELWQRLSAFTKLANLPETLLRYRIHSQSIGSVHAEGQRDLATTICLNGLKRLNITPSEQESELHRKIFVFGYEKTKTRAFGIAAEEWLLKLSAADQASETFDRRTLDVFLAETWFRICSSITLFGLWTLKLYLSSPLKKHSPMGAKQNLKFLVKCLLR